MLLAIDVGNTRLKWAHYPYARPGAQPLAQGAEFLENIDKLADGPWRELPVPQQMIGCTVAADADGVPTAFACATAPATTPCATELATTVGALVFSRPAAERATTADAADAGWADAARSAERRADADLGVAV
jgi:hypothetical protein